MLNLFSLFMENIVTLCVENTDLMIIFAFHKTDSKFMLNLILPLDLDLEE